MSIALSATVQPSRLLRMFLLLMGVALLLAAASLLPRADWYARAACGAALLGVLALWRAHSRLGVARLEVMNDGRLFLARTGQEASSVRLLPGSTIWARMLVLRLRHDASARIESLLVLPDSLPEAELRALVVACRWIEARVLHQDA